jgi:aspartate racemase
MKTIGLIGGMSWESSAEYYRLINEAIKAELGGLHSAQLLLYSVDFAAIERLQHAGDWDAAGAILADAARRLERGGADALFLCTNTMHKVASTITGAVSIPFVHIADPTATAIRDAGIGTIGLLGTRFTMEQEFYRGRLEEGYGLRVLVPDEADRETVHRVIYDELCLGTIRAESRAEYRAIMARLVDKGAEGIILGCTEITLLVDGTDATVPLFDTTSLHARAAARLAITPELQPSRDAE